MTTLPHIADTQSLYTLRLHTPVAIHMYTAICYSLQSVPRASDDVMLNLSLYRKAYRNLLNFHQQKFQFLNVQLAKISLLQDPLCINHNCVNNFHLINFRPDEKFYKSKLR